MESVRNHKNTMSAAPAGNNIDKPIPHTGMSEAFSLLLDMLRFCAASLVVAGHLTQPYFSKGWPNLTGMAFSMVAVFFVLSGFVIRYTTDIKPFEPLGYFTDRFARIYSVLVPAVILTFFADSLSRHLNPGFYGFNFGGQTENLPWRLFSVLFFINQAYGQDISWMSNSPIWSLGYEVPYYLAFGFFFYFRGWRRWLPMLLLLLVQGPNIFVLFPLWLSGCWLYTTTKQQAPKRSTGFLLLFLCVVLASGLYRISPPSLPALPDEWLWLDTIRQGRSHAFVTAFQAGVLTVSGLLCAYHLQECYAKKLLSIRKAIQALSAMSFSIYLYHFPLLVLFRSVFHYDKTDSLSKILILCATLVLCFLLSLVTERKKNIWRSWISAILRKAAKDLRMSR